LTPTVTVNGDRELDYVGAEYPCEPVAGAVEIAAVYTFATEPELAAWVAADPKRRAYRGAQRRLVFGGDER
jgi:hypothetical protein